ncbi:MAG: pyridoxal-phosphate dependent enzyme [Thermoplasmata archaeon]
MSDPVSLVEIQAAHERIRSTVLRSPLVPSPGREGLGNLLLKLDNLQPTGSFKVRGAGNSLAVAFERGHPPGVYTTSAGNMAQALAWHARRLNVPCTVIVPETAPEVKLAGIRRYGAQVIQLSWERVWDVMTAGIYPPLKDMLYVPPFNSREMIAGNGTAGLEIFEDLPSVRTVFVPLGGGGLIAGVASALRALNPQTELVACEVETAAPFAASLRAGALAEVERVPSFVDGIGARNMLPQMWDRLNGLVTRSRVLSLASVAAAIRYCFEQHHIVIEGAAGTAVAAALEAEEGSGPVVALVSGGNIDVSTFTTILEGKVPPLPGNPRLSPSTARPSDRSNAVEGRK